MSGLSRTANGKQYHVSGFGCNSNDSVTKSMQEQRMNALIAADQPKLSMPIDQMKVSGLKEECKKNNIDTSGCKLRKDYESKLKNVKH